MPELFFPILAKKKEEELLLFNKIFSLNYLHYLPGDLRDVSPKYSLRHTLVLNTIPATTTSV